MTNIPIIGTYIQLFIKDKHGIWSGSGLGYCSLQQGNTEQPYWDYNSTYPILPCQREYKTNTEQPYWDYNSTYPILPCQREYKTNTEQLYWDYNSNLEILSHHD